VHRSKESFQIASAVHHTENQDVVAVYARNDDILAHRKTPRARAEIFIACTGEGHVGSGGPAGELPGVGNRRVVVGAAVDGGVERGRRVVLAPMRRRMR